MTKNHFENRLNQLIDISIINDPSQGFSVRVKDLITCLSTEGNLIQIDINEKNADDKFSPQWLNFHRFIYKKRPDIHVLTHSTMPYTVTAAKAGRDVPPLLDDFAQLVGVTTRVVTGHPGNPGFASQLVKGLAHRNAVLIPTIGGLCGAGSFDDTIAVAQVLEKGCRALIDSYFLGGGHKINFLESWLMRLVYRHKYSRMIKSEQPI